MEFFKFFKKEQQPQKAKSELDEGIHPTIAHEEKQKLLQKMEEFFQTSADVPPASILLKPLRDFSTELSSKKVTELNNFLLQYSHLLKGEIIYLQEHGENKADAWKRAAQLSSELQNLDTVILENKKFREELVQSEKISEIHSKLQNVYFGGTLSKTEIRDLFYMIEKVRPADFSEDLRRGIKFTREIDEEHILNELVFNWELLPKLRQAKKEDYEAWKRGYVLNSGDETKIPEWTWPNEWYVTKEDFRMVPLYGSMSVNIIVPKDIKYLGGKLGHCNLLFMDGYKKSER